MEHIKFSSILYVCDNQMIGCEICIVLLLFWEVYFILYSLLDQHVMVFFGKYYSYSFCYVDILCLLTRKLIYIADMTFPLIEIFF
jgi:hypothetical protein